MYCLKDPSNLNNLKEKVYSLRDFSPLNILKRKCAVLVT